MFHSSPFKIFTAIPIGDATNYAGYFSVTVGSHRHCLDRVPALLTEKSKHAHVVLRIERDGGVLWEKVRETCLLPCFSFLFCLEVPEVEVTEVTEISGITQHMRVLAYSACR